MPRVETMHNTPAQVREYLAEALAIVAELEVTDELRAVAFTKALDLLASKSITIQPPQPMGLATPLGGPRLAG